MSTVNPSKNKSRYKSVIIGSIVGLAVLGYFFVGFPHNEVESKDIVFKTNYVDDSSLELGDQQTRQEGEAGTNETEYRVKRTLSGREISRTKVTQRTVKTPTNKTIAKGTKRYQFMWCSDGTYRYFSNDQFKNPGAGFTHLSLDSCTQNKQGHMINLADSAPPAPTYQSARSSYTPTYTPAQTYSPTTCYTQYHSYGGYFDPSATTNCY